MHSETIQRYSKILLVFTILAGYGAPAVGEFQISPSAAKPANPAMNPYDARSYPDKLEIYRGGEKISLIKSEKPDIERWGFVDSGNLVVVKSRGEDGSTIYELFDTVTGELRDKAVGAEDKESLPIWAVDFIE